MKELHRGYIAEKSRNFQPKLESEIVLKEAIKEPRFDPESLDCAGRLIWASSNEAGARAIVNSRFFIKFALDPEFRKTVISDKSFLPAIASFQAEQEDIFCYNIPFVEPFGGNYSDQLIIQKVKSESTNIKLPTQESLDTVIDFISGSNEIHSVLLDCSTVLIRISRRIPRPYEKMLLDVGASGRNFIDGINVIFNLLQSGPYFNDHFGLEEGLTSGLHKYQYIGGFLDYK